MTADEARNASILEATKTIGSMIREKTFEGGTHINYNNYNLPSQVWKEVRDILNNKGYRVIENIYGVEISW